MKRTLSLLLAAMVLTVPTGCGCSLSGTVTSSGVSSHASVPLSAESVTGELPVLGICLYKYDDTYISTVRQNLEKISAGRAKLEINDGKGDQAAQNDQIDLMIQKGVDCLTVNIVDIGAAQTVVEKARQADIPLIFFNREPDTAVIKSYDKARFVGTTAREAGVIQGEIAAKVWGDGSQYDRNKDGVMSYVMLQGEPNNPEVIARTEWSVKTIKEKGISVKELGLQVCDWDASKAQAAMETWLNKFPNDIEMVLSNNDGMAQGAIAALNAVGFNTETNAKGVIPVLGVDATDAARDLIARKMMTGTVLQDAQGMADSVFALSMNAAMGKEYLDATPYHYDETGIAVRIPYQAFEG